jgi:hypothetical protein
MERTDGISRIERDSCKHVYNQYARRGARDIATLWWGGMLRIMGKRRVLYAKSPPYRGFVQKARQIGILPKNLNEYFGYGLFVGQKL